MSPPVKLCQHDEYRVGCLSCCAHDFSDELEEAVAQGKETLETVQRYEALLAQSNISRNEREHYEEKRKRATEQNAAFRERSRVLRGKIDDVEKQVKDLCDAHESSKLPEAFEADAVIREEEREQIWRTRVSVDADSESVKFQREDLSREVPFEGLDRANIPATPDWLVNDGVGLQMFLTMANRLPTRVVGQQTGPAIMSYGAALAMFGEPDLPGENTAAAAGQPQPRTEHEVRLNSDGPTPTTALLSEDEQWALFGNDKFMTNTALLARQYVKPVAQKAQDEKKREEDAKKGKPTVESSAADSSIPEPPPRTPQ